MCGGMAGSVSAWLRWERYPLAEEVAEGRKDLDVGPLNHQGAGLT